MRAIGTAGFRRCTTPVLLVVLLVLALPACGGGGETGEATPAKQPAPAATTTAEEPEPITVELREVGGSGQSGKATLTPTGTGSIETFAVELELQPAGESPQMAHVHEATCAEYAEIEGFDAQIATVRSPLSDVREGTSESTVSGSIATGELSINVHEPAHPFAAVACGDIPGTND